MAVRCQVYYSRIALRDITGILSFAFRKYFISVRLVLPMLYWSSAASSQNGVSSLSSSQCEGCTIHRHAVLLHSHRLSAMARGHQSPDDAETTAFPAQTPIEPPPQRWSLSPVSISASRKARAHPGLFEQGRRRCAPNGQVVLPERYTVLEASNAITPR